MNFWKRSIVPVLLALLALTGLFAQEHGPRAAGSGDSRSELCCAECRECLDTVLRCVPGTEPDFAFGSDTTGSEDSGKSRKKSRKCWRPDRTVSVALTPVKSPAEDLRPQFAACEITQPSPASSDLLFIVGGYTRLFQKG